MTPRLTLLLLGLCCTWLGGCRSPLRLQESIPTVAFRGAAVEDVRLTPIAADNQLVLGLRFGFRNPYSKAFQVPAHEVRFELNGEQFPVQVEGQAGFEVPAGEEVVRTYRLNFSLDPARMPGEILGRDNAYRFTSSFAIDLADYGIHLPMGLGQRTLEFSFEETLRLPLLPTVSPANQPGQVSFLGTMERLDLGQLRTTMTPLVDLLLEAKFPSTASSGFLQMLEMEVPNPNLLGQSQTIKLGDHMVNVLKVFVPDAAIKWEAFLAQVAPTGNVKLMDHLVQNFLKPINSSAPQNWNNFKSGWQSFKQQPAVIEYPGMRVTGLRVSLPVRINNPNRFPIEAPSSFLSTQLGSNYHPIVLRAQPTGSSEIPAGGSRTLSLQLELDWSGLSQGWMGLINGQALTPALSGATTVDLGYGPTTLAIDLPAVPVQFGPP